MVELDGPDIIEVTMEGKQASPVLRTKLYDMSDSPSRKYLLLTPNFDLVIIATGD